MTRIPVQTASRSYEVLVERGLLSSASAVLRDLLRNQSKIFVVSTQPILDHWGSVVLGTLAEAKRSAVLLVMPDGEVTKRLSTLEKLASAMVAAGADRHSVILAVGGGVVGDVAGFLASMFMRGIPIVQVPTTLVAQVDSAVGGKTGVNLPSGKNLIGTFHPPLAVLADPDVLKTLPDREYRSGLFEAMKYGVIRNPAIFDLMESRKDGFLGRDGELLEQLIIECVKVKAAVVSADEREDGERKILNFGHTIGHALESATKYRVFLHGEAVGWGMVAAASIGKEVGITEPAVAERIAALVLAYGPLPAIKVAAKRVLKLLQSDKKTLGGVPHFILAKSMGKVEVVNSIEPGNLLRAITDIASLSRA